MDNLIIRFGKNEDTFLFPAGNKNTKEVIDWILSTNKNLTFCSLVEEQVEFLKKNYPEKFEYFEDRAMSDYIYTTESLKTLTGKKLSSKRNHINRFVENNPDWSFEEICDSNLQEVIKMHDNWCKINNTNNEVSLTNEGYAVKIAINNYKKLNLSGGLIRANGEVIAFSFGEKLNNTTFLVHIEKAYHHIQGAYPMINKQFVIHFCDGFLFVDREEDTGDEGLRKAKLSYNPCNILRKFNAKVICD